MKPRILVIDDEAAIRDSLRMILEYENYEFVGAASGPDGLAIIKRDAPDLVLLDIKMPAMNGLETLTEIRKVDEALPVAMISGHGTITDAMQATRLGAFDFIEKPFTSERVLVTVTNGLAVRELRQENRALKLAMEVRYEIVGDSQALRAVLESVKRAAPTNATVMLLGESGVGKELVARTIHRNSAARGTAVHSSQLRGHSRRAHRIGAVRSRERLVHRRHRKADRQVRAGGSRHDLPRRSGRHERQDAGQGASRAAGTGSGAAGSARTIKVDVRVVAATNKNLEEMIQRGEFREDLYFRLNVIPILVPPLRERRTDIPLLVQHFARRMSDEHNMKPKRFDPRAMEALQRYRWRGNIRELRNTVERVMIMAAGDVIRLEDLPRDIRGDVTAPAFAETAPLAIGAALSSHCGGTRRGGHSS